MESLRFHIVQFHDNGCVNLTERIGPRFTNVPEQKEFCPIHGLIALRGDLLADHGDIQADFIQKLALIGYLTQSAGQIQNRLHFQIRIGIRRVLLRQ